jgi:hypothetical protein
MLVAGYPSSFEVVVDGLDLPVTAQLRAQFRVSRDAPVLIDLSTASGSITVPEPGRIVFAFTAAQSGAVPDRPLMFDVARVDGSPVFLGFEGSIRFHRPVTRP